MSSISERLSDWRTTPPPFRVLWKIYVQESSGLRHWVYRRAPSQDQALAEMRRERPTVQMLQIERVQSPD